MRIQHGILSLFFFGAAAVVAAMTVGCGKQGVQEAGANNATNGVKLTPVLTETVTPKFEGWEEVEEEEAEYIADVKLTIPDITENDQAFAIRKIKPVEEEQLFSLGCYHSSIGCGPNGSVGGGINLIMNEDDEKSIVLKIAYSWTISGQEGVMKEKIRLNINVNSEITFANGAQLSVSWREGKSQ